MVSSGDRTGTADNAKLDTGTAAMGVNVGDDDSPLDVDDTGCIVKIGEVLLDDTTVCTARTGETDIPSALERPDRGKKVPDVFMVEFGVIGLAGEILEAEADTNS